MNGDAEAALEEATDWFDNEYRSIMALVRFLSNGDLDDLLLMEELVSSTSNFFPVKGMWSEWREMLEPAAKSAAARGDWERASNYLTSLGNTSMRLGLYDRARTELVEALKMAQVHQVHSVEPVAMSSLAGLEKRLGHADRSAELLEEAVGKYQCVGNERGEAQALGDLASSLDALGDPERALLVHAEARDIFDALGDRYSAMKETGNTAIALLKLRRWSEAEQLLREVIELAEALGASRELTAANRDLAYALGGQGKFEEADELLALVLDSSKALGPYEEALVLGQSAQVELMKQNQIQAAKLLARQARLYEEAGIALLRSESLFRRGAILAQMALLDEAKHSFREAILEGDEADHGPSLRAQTALAFLLAASGEFDEALSRSSHAASVYREGEDWDGLGQMLELQQFVCERLGLTDQAADAANELRKLKDRLRD